MLIVRVSFHPRTKPASRTHDWWSSLPMICAASELIETSIVFVKSSDDDAFSPKQLTLICVDGKYGA
jgi:hypothetical protein